MGTLGGNAAVHRQGAREGQHDKHNRRDRGQQAGGQCRNCGLIAEGGEVIHPGEAHDPPPGMSLFHRLRVGADVAAT